MIINRVAHLRFRPNGAKCESLGQRPRKDQPHKNQSPNGAEPTVLHRVVPPRWGFSIGWPRKPRAMPWAFTLWAFGPETHGAWNRNRRCTLAIPPRMGQNVIAWGNAPGKGKAKTKAPTGRNQRCCIALFRPIGAFRQGGPVHPGRCPGLSPCGPLARNHIAREMGLWPGITLRVKWAFGPESHCA